MRAPMVQPIIIAAGGTGGHMFPAEALSAALLARGERIVLMTDRRSGALASPVFANAERFVLSGAGIAGRGVWRGARAVASLGAGAFMARGLIARLAPAVLVGFGGYPSVAPVLAARMVKDRPTILLHEQNAVLGRANRFLSRFADQMALGFADTLGVPSELRATVIGNPVRPAILALRDAPYAPPTHRVHLLVVGGSLGARAFGDLIPPALAALPEAMRARLSVVQQCRVEDIARVRDAYAAAGIEAELARFFTDIDAKLAWAHLVIGRAGASTVAELGVAGRPAFLIPLPGAIDDHQAANAAALARVGGAIVMRQAEITTQGFSAYIAALIEAPGELARMAQAAASAGRPDAAERLADLVLDAARARAAA